MRTIVFKNGALRGRRLLLPTNSQKEAKKFYQSLLEMGELVSGALTELRESLLDALASAKTTLTGFADDDFCPLPVEDRKGT